VNAFVTAPRRAVRALVQLAAACVLLAVAACHSRPQRVLTDADYPGELLPPAALGADLLWQQRVTASWGDGEQRGFDAAVQKQGDVLTVIGLSPLGQAGFVMVQRGLQVTSEHHTDMHLPFPPRYVLLDVQRAFFPWLPLLGTGSAGDGERERIVGQERIVEVHKDGRLVERRFTRLDGKPAGAIVVRYEWAGTDASRRAPARAVLDNGWFGYRLTVDTHTEAALPPEGA
jgi:hypothetical protein